MTVLGQGSDTCPGVGGYTAFFFSHPPVKNLVAKQMLLAVQSVNIPTHTAIGPQLKKRMSTTVRNTRQVHIVMDEVIMENFTSPAARIP